MDTNQNRRNYNNYIEGNVARQLRTVPRPYVEEETIRKQPVRKHRVKPRVNAGIDLLSFMMIFAAVVFTLYTCITYLGVQSDYTQKNKEITNLERSLSKLQEENSQALARINASLDLNYIYKVATKELGMVYPNQNQVITYESALSDYVRQYGDIPEANQESLLDKLLK